MSSFFDVLVCKGLGRDNQTKNVKNILTLKRKSTPFSYSIYIFCKQLGLKENRTTTVRIRNIVVIRMAIVVYITDVFFLIIPYYNLLTFIIIAKI